jgi:hypothetical protein
MLTYKLEIILIKAAYDQFHTKFLVPTSNVNYIIDIKYKGKYTSRETVLLLFYILQQRFTKVVLF